MKTCYLIFLSLISLFLILVPWFHSSQALHESFHDQAHENRHELDPTEFFKGSAPRPKLEIIHPENGQILDDGVLQIKIRLHGYELPSHFHDSSLCIALSNRNIEIGEQCFDQSADLDFHITGLSPRETYSLQVLFLERGRIIAMSVRSFRVGGILLDAVDGNQAVSIETAIQVGVKAQMEGSYDQAEMIYRNVLSENPSHPQALHLLGVIFIQKGSPILSRSRSLSHLLPPILILIGDHSQAVPYIEQALVSNSTRDDSTMSYAVFHNNLGECYRYLGLHLPFSPPPPPHPPSPSLHSLLFTQAALMKQK
jgi:tetratricopeptide (TPR) repeat protein